MNEIAGAMKRSTAEPAAFAIVYRSQFAPVLDRLLRRVWDSEIAVDLAAETIAEAFIQRRRFRGETDAELVGWLNGIANRKLARFYRDHAIEKRALRKVGIDSPHLSDDEHREVMSRIDLSACRGELHAALASLSEGQRAAITLRVVEERPYAEVARLLNISEDAARARVARALSALRQRFNPDSIQEQFV